MLILLFGYAAICVVLFKLLRVPVNQWTATTAILLGIVVVGVLVLGMNYNHPLATDGRFYFYTTPIIPTVKGRVTEVAAQTQKPLKAGDILFRIDPRPYQAVVDQKKALLADAEQNVLLLRTSYDQALAAVGTAKAQVQLAEEHYNRQRELFQKKVVTEVALETATRNLETARQAMAGAEAAAERARLAHVVEVGGINTAVARLQAELRNAELDLSETTVRAPTDGYVTQMLLRPGMVASSSTAMLIFIHSDTKILIATFAQTVLQRVREGAEVEVSFDGIPGQVFGGNVSIVGDAIALGQLQPSSNLLNPDDRSKSLGRNMSLINVSADLSAYHLPAGATAQVAVYSEHWRWVAVFRRLTLRINAWLNYIM
jgi:multidrug resistance efflux pump